MEVVSPTALTALIAAPEKRGMSRVTIAVLLLVGALIITVIALGVSLGLSAPRDTVAVTGTVYFTGATMAELEEPAAREEFDTNFVDAMVDTAPRDLRVKEEDVTILSLTEGSVIVEYEVLLDEGGDPDYAMASLPRSLPMKEAHSNTVGLPRIG